MEFCGKHGMEPNALMLEGLSGKQQDGINTVLSAQHFQHKVINTRLSTQGYQHNGINTTLSTECSQHSAVKVIGGVSFYTVLKHYR